MIFEHSQSAHGSGNCFGTRTIVTHESDARRLLSSQPFCAAGLVSVRELQHLKVTYALTGFLSKTDHSLADDATMKKRYRLGGNTLMVIVAKRSGGWLTTAAIQDLRAKSSLLSSMDGVISAT
jgi:predicted RND superfamily exporter protein